jgi:AbrB family looped-hinge helix DNA binding protein
MSTATIGVKGRITIPIEVMRELRLSKGDKLTFSVNAATKTVEVKKVVAVDGLTVVAHVMIELGVKPVKDANVYY